MNVDQLKTHIAERAYYLWQQQGCPDGYSLQNWLQAESELGSPPPRAVVTPAAKRVTKPAKKNARRH